MTPVMLPLLAALLASAPPPADAPARTMLVLPLAARAGVPAGEAALLSDYLANEARRVPGYKVLSLSDVEQMLAAETRAQLVGCDGTGCLAEIGGALQADEVLTGSLGRLGQHEMVLTLTRISPRQVTVLGGESERITGGQDAALDGVSRALGRLHPGYVAPAPRTRPMSRAVLAGLVTAAGAAAQYAAFASMFTSVLFVPCPACAVAMAGGSAAACCAAPVYGSALQAWLLDFVGRRQAGFRHAAAVGLVLLGLDVTWGLAVAGALALAGYGLGLAGPEELNARTEAAQRLWKVFIPIQDRLPLDYALVGASAGVLACVAGMVLLVPFGQAVTLVMVARERPPDVDPQPPALYAPDEEAPGWMPGWRVVGGGPR